MVQLFQENLEKLEVAEKVRDQLLAKLDKENAKTSEFAKMLDLVRSFTPKYFETVRLLLDESTVSSKKYVNF